MTRSEVIELANQLSERKGEKVLTMPTLFRFVVQDICKRQRFWWRRIGLNWTLTPGTKTYDLSDGNLFPTLKEIAIEEITKITTIQSANPLQKTELVPVFDPETLIEMTLNTQQVAPGRYTIQGGSSSILLIDPPDLPYSTYLVGWGMPNPASDTASDAVPLIPTWGHNTVVAGMVAKVFKFAYGSTNSKTVDATEEYEQGLVDLMEKKQFDPNYVLSLSNSDSAIRST